ncbi:MAG TPA: zinc-binding dehydrogenase [Mycobacteriales bacterium]|jgi:NADPH:quinone reductase-like Zn-dependent oxidoreductase|nr:zinc-binding dehydrogenase [Mycobacteriales bacterium]
MLAAYAARASDEDPLSALEVGEIDPPEAPEGWISVEVKAAALNHHDIWSLRGVGLPEDKLPMILGCDAAGIGPDGGEVIVHAVIGDGSKTGGDETLDPKRSLLSEVYPGTLAERVSVPAGNVLPKPAGLSWEEAASLPTAWLTAYRMLFTKAEVQAGQTILVQGAGGGVATAAIALANAAGVTVWATSRSEAKRAKAEELGADQTFEPGARLPGRVDAVIETVGDATFGHSLKSVRPGGRVVVCGSTSGGVTPLELQRTFFLQLEILGSTMGTKAEFAALLAFLGEHGVRPPIDSTFPLADARSAMAKLHEGDVFGKIVLTN